MRGSPANLKLLGLHTGYPETLSFEETTGPWISRAEVAEEAFTAFSSP